MSLAESSRMGQIKWSSSSSSSVVLASQREEALWMGAALCTGGLLALPSSSSMLNISSSSMMSAAVLTSEDTGWLLYNRHYCLCPENNNSSTDETLQMHLIGVQRCHMYVHLQTKAGRGGKNSLESHVRVDFLKSELASREECKAGHDKVPAAAM